MRNKFDKWLDRNWDPHGLCPPELPKDQAFDFLVDAMLPKNFCTTMPMNGKQANVEIVATLIRQHQERIPWTEKFMSWIRKPEAD